MPRSPVDTVRLNNEAFSRRDLDAMMALHAPDAAIVDRRPVGFGEFHGHAAIRSYYEGIFDNTDALDERLGEVRSEGDAVIAAFHLRATLSGQDAPETFNYALRFTFDAEGRIATVDIYEDSATALS